MSPRNFCSHVSDHNSLGFGGFVLFVLATHTASGSFQARDPRHSSNHTHSSDTARSLAQWAIREFPGHCGLWPSSRVQSPGKKPISGGSSGVWWVKDLHCHCTGSGLVVARVPSLAWERPHAESVAKNQNRTENPHSHHFSCWEKPLTVWFLYLRLLC